MPELPEALVAEPGVVYTVASGDLRAAANVDVAGRRSARSRRTSRRGRRARVVTSRRGHPVDAASGHGFIDNQRTGIDVFAGIASRRAARRRRGGVAVQPPRPARAPHHKGPILLVANWPASSPGWSASSTSRAELTKAGVRHSTLWSEDFTDDWAARQPRGVARDGHASPTTPSHVRDLRRDRPTARRRNWASARGRSCGATRRSSASSTRAAWGCTTRSSTTSCSTRSGSSRSGCRQSALVAEMARSATTRRRRRAPGSTTRGMTFHDGRRRGGGPDRRPGPQPVQDVHRRAADRRRLRAATRSASSTSRG